MQYIIYLATAFLATTIGAMTGMGGGVIIKPLLDAFGDYGSANIGVLSSITVFAMSIVSIFRQARSGKAIYARMAVLLALGSTAGGVCGERLLAMLIVALNANRAVIVTQNICLGVIIALIILYLNHKDKIKTYRLTGVAPIFLAGAALGMISSFLGIGGGPINVALLMILFSLDLKLAAVYSLISIFFAQIAKLATVAATTGFAIYSLSMLWVMVPGAILGGLAGSALNKRLPEKQLAAAFKGIQLFILALCIWNIVRQ